MISTGAAILGSALIGGGASLFASRRQSGAARDAGRMQAESLDRSTRMQIDAQERARELQMRLAQEQDPIQRRALEQSLSELQTASAQMFSTADRASGNLTPFINEFEPYRNLGDTAVNSLRDLYNFGPNSDAYKQIEKSPEYQFAFEQGKKATENAATARGNFLSPNANMDLQRFGQGLASQQFGNYFNRLTSMAGVGQNAITARGNLANTQNNYLMTAAQGGANLANAGATMRTNVNQGIANQWLGLGQNVGNQMVSGAANIGNQTVASGNAQANSIMAQGQADASGIVGASNALTGGVSSYLNNNMLMAALNRGGGWGAGSSYGGGQPMNLLSFMRS